MDDFLEFIGKIITYFFLAVAVISLITNEYQQGILCALLYIGLTIERFTSE